MFYDVLHLCLDESLEFSFSIFIDIAVITIENKHQTEKQKPKKTQTNNKPSHTIYYYCLKKSAL